MVSKALKNRQIAFNEGLVAWELGAYNSSMVRGGF
jgi:hypothetical protein